MGQNLSVSSGNSYLWWLNGVNRASQVAPTKTKTLTIRKSGTTAQVYRIIAWDMTTSGLSDNNTGDEFSIVQGSTIFGLTSSSGTSIIHNITFVDDFDAFVTFLTNQLNTVTLTDISTVIDKYISGSRTIKAKDITQLVEQYQAQ